MKTTSKAKGKAADVTEKISAIVHGVSTGQSVAIADDDVRGQAIRQLNQALGTFKVVRLAVHSQAHGPYLHEDRSFGRWHQAVHRAAVLIKAAVISLEDDDYADRFSFPLETALDMTEAAEEELASEDYVAQPSAENLMNAIEAVEDCLQDDLQFMASAPAEAVAA